MMMIYIHSLRTEFNSVRPNIHEMVIHNSKFLQQMFQDFEGVYDYFLDNRHC